MNLELLTWNVAGRTVLLEAQAAAVERREPDLVALQEIRPSTAGRWREVLEPTSFREAAAVAIEAMHAEEGDLAAMS